MVRINTPAPRPVIYSLSLSLNGHIIGPDGGFDWSVPDEELFRFSIDEIRGVGAHLLGRRLYETMLCWDEPDPSWDDAEHEFATIWRDLPKTVFSRTLTTVTGANTRLATGTVEEEITRLRAEPASGAIAVGGADLAHSVIDAGLVDEYRMRFRPVLVGGGVPFFSHAGQWADLELIGGRQFAGGSRLRGVPHAPIGLALSGGGGIGSAWCLVGAEETQKFARRNAAVTHGT